MKEQLDINTELTVDPEVFYRGTFARNQALGPERTLLLAVLEDAIDCFRKYSAAHNRAGRNRFAEAEGWIMGNRDDWVFSFENVCDFLGLDPDYVRGGLMRWKLETVNAPAAPRYRQFRRAV